MKYGLQPPPPPHTHTHAHTHVGREPYRQTHTHTHLCKEPYRQTHTLRELDCDVLIKSTVYCSFDLNIPGSSNPGFILCTVILYKAKYALFKKVEQRIKISPWLFCM